MEPITATQANFPFPAELHVKILSLLLIADSDIPLWFNPLQGNKNGHIEAIRNFFILNQVSKAVREETHEIFFSRNRFQFRSLQYVSTVNLRNQHNSTQDITQEMAERWIKQAALRMIDITLHVNGKYDDYTSDVREVLKCTTNILRESTRLRRLHVDFLNWMLTYYRERGGMGSGQYFYLLIAASGRRKNTPREKLALETWSEVEVEALEPLTALRGLEHVCVAGSVTNRWALYLEACMRPSPGTSVPDYEEGEEIPDPRWPDGSEPT